MTLQNELGPISRCTQDSQTTTGVEQHKVGGSKVIEKTRREQEEGRKGT